MYVKVIRGDVDQLFECDCYLIEPAPLSADPEGTTRWLCLFRYEKKRERVPHEVEFMDNMVTKIKIDLDDERGCQVYVMNDNGRTVEHPIDFPGQENTKMTVTKVQGFDSLQASGTTTAP